MINGPAWSQDVAHTQVRTTKGKDLERFDKLDLEVKLYEMKIALNNV